MCKAEAATICPNDDATKTINFRNDKPAFQHLLAQFLRPEVKEILLGEI